LQFAAGGLMQPVSLNTDQLSVWIGEPGPSPEVPSSGYQVYTSPSTPNTQAKAKKLFSSFDTNNDGRISQSEFTPAVTGVGGTANQASTLFSPLNTNGDGSMGPLHAKD
jgi:hypothetical protein